MNSGYGSYGGSSVIQTNFVRVSGVLIPRHVYNLVKNDPARLALVVQQAKAKAAQQKAAAGGQPTVKDATTVMSSLFKGSAAVTSTITQATGKSPPSSASSSGEVTIDIDGVEETLLVEEPPASMFPGWLPYLVVVAGIAVAGAVGYKMYKKRKK